MITMSVGQEYTVVAKDISVQCPSKGTCAQKKKEDKKMFHLE